MNRCPLCDTEMRHTIKRLLLECPHCGAMATTNVVRSHWANRLAVERVEQLGADMLKRTEPLTGYKLAELIRHALYVGGTR